MLVALVLVGALWLLVSAAMQSAATRAATLAAREAPPCFRAPPGAPASGQPLRLAFFGDLQKGVTDVVDPLAKALRAEGAHLLVCSGDFVSHGEAPYYGIVLDAFARADVRTPVRVVPGNHDLYPRRSKDDRIGGPLFEGHFGPRQWVLDLGPLRLVGVDTGADWTIKKQLPQIERALEAQGGAPWVAVTHRPPFQFDDEPATLYPDLGPLAAFFETHRPALVVAGHLHQFKDVVVNHVRYIVNAHGGDVAGDTLRRRNFELVFLDVAADGSFETRIEQYARRTSLRALRHKLYVRMWADRRKRIGRVLAAPAAILWKLFGWYVPVVHHPVQRRFPSREEVEQRQVEQVTR